MTVVDFKKCRFDPSDPDFWTTAQELHEMGGERMMKWVVMVYDPNSSLVKSYPDLNERKSVAEGLSGHLSYHAPAEAEAITAYLKLIKKRRWASTMAIENALWEMIEMIQRPVEEVGAGQDKDKLAASNMKKITAENIVALNVMLDQLYTEFDPQEGVKEEPEKKPEVNMTAEGIAKSLKRKKTVS